MALFLPQRWKSQPQYAARPDKRGFVWLPHSGDLGLNLQPVAGTAIYRPSLAGVAAYNAGSTTNRIEYDTPYADGDMTIIAVCSFTTVGTGRTIAGVFKSTGSAVANYLSLEASSRIAAVSTDNGNWQIASGRIAAANTVYSVVGTFKSGGKRAVFVNGAKDAENTTARTPTAMNKLLLGSYLGSGSYSSAMTGDIYMTAILPVYLSDAEALDLSVNPWQIFKPQSARIYSFPSGGSSYTLTVDKGTLTLTGQTVTFNAALGVTKADLTATGQSVGFGATIAVGNGTLTLTGQDVSLVTSGNYSLAVDKGTLTLAGQTVTFNASLGVTKGDLALTGKTATFDASLAVGKGTLALVGQDVTLTAQTDYTLAVDAGTLSLVGQDVALTLGGQTVNPPVGGGRPGRTYAYPSEPSRKRRKAHEKRQETTSAPEETPKPYEVAGRLGAITEVPDNVVPLPVSTTIQVVTGSPIEPVQKSLEEVVREAVQKAMAEYQAVQDGEKILKQLEKEEAELSLSEVECLLLLAMVE